MPVVFAGLLVFYSSAAVLVLEILAVRILAPYVGDSLETYTGIISICLAGIAVGSWWGGKLADRIQPKSLLGPLILAGGAFTLFTLPLVRVLGAAFAGGGPAAIIILSFVGFFAPCVLLTAVTPTIIKIQLADLEETGQTVGWYSGLGTIGALTGSVITGFVLVAAWPTQPITLTLGGSLVLLGLGLWIKYRPQLRIRLSAMLVLAALAALLTVAIQSPCQVESAYFCARVAEDPENPDGRILWLDTLRHSYVDLDDPTHLEFDYTQMFGDVLETFDADEPVDVLHIGGGGFSMPRYVEATRPGSDNLVYEIDPTLVDIAQADLGLEPSEGLEIEHRDARLGVAQQPAGRWDAVIGDAFGGLAVPWHLATVELTQHVADTLQPGGVYMINVIDYQPLRFARAEAKTLAEVFDHVAVIASPGHFDGTEGGNQVLVASDQPLDLDTVTAAIHNRSGDQIVVTGTDLEAWVGDVPVLTDDYAPVDQLLTHR